MHELLCAEACGRKSSLICKLRWGLITGRGSRGFRAEIPGPPGHPCRRWAQTHFLTPWSLCVLTYKMVRQRLALLAPFYKKAETRRPWVIVDCRRGRGSWYFHDFESPIPRLECRKNVLDQKNAVRFGRLWFRQPLPRRRTGKCRHIVGPRGKCSLSELRNGMCSINISNWLISLIFYLQMRKRKLKRLIMNSILSGMRWLHFCFLTLFQWISYIWLFHLWSEVNSSSWKENHCISPLPLPSPSVAMETAMQFKEK